MPYKHKEYLIPTKLKKNVKLTVEQKKEIFYLYNIVKKYSQRELAKKYNVSRRTITFCIDPEKQKRNLEMRKKRGGSKIYYNKNKNTIAMKKHRQYKQELYLQNKLKKKENEESI